MGMGEPFLNYDNFIAAVHLLTGHMRIPEQRMTVSTSGILPGIERYAARAHPPQPRPLAQRLQRRRSASPSCPSPANGTSPHSSPPSRSHPPLKGRQYVTFEYVLLGGINDQPQHATELITLLNGLRAKINLIVWNAGPSMPFEAPPRARIDSFQQRLIAAGIPTFVRRPRGADIYAACGQLKRTLEDSTPELVSLA